MKLERVGGGFRTMSRARLHLLLNAIWDQIAAEAQLTAEESIEFSSKITIILGFVYKQTFRMARSRSSESIT